MLFKINQEMEFHTDEELFENDANSDSFVEMIEAAICKITTSS